MMEVIPAINRYLLITEQNEFGVTIRLSVRRFEQNSTLNVIIII